jgi:hypothetical protein
MISGCCLTKAENRDQLVFPESRTHECTHTHAHAHAHTHTHTHAHTHTHTHT